MPAPVIYTQFNPPPYSEWEKNWAVNDGVTQQQFKDECDIQKILERYYATNDWASLEAIQNRASTCWDFSTVENEYQGYVEQIEQAQAMFMALPGDLRQRFGNNPQELFTWLDNPANKDEAVALKLVPEDYPGFQG